jgi:hypothetical protein
MAGAVRGMRESPALEGVGSYVPQKGSPGGLGYLKDQSMGVHAVPDANALRRRSCDFDARTVSVAFRTFSPSLGGIFLSKVPSDFLHQVLLLKIQSRAMLAYLHSHVPRVTLLASGHG